MNGNGLDRVVTNLAKDLVTLGFKVDLVVPEVTEYHKLVMQTLPAEVRTVDLGLPLSQTIHLRKIVKLKQYLEQEKPAILLANGDYVGVSNLAKMFSNASTKIVHGVHINLSRYFGKMSGLRAKIRPLLLNHFYRRSDGIIAVSKGVAEDLSQTSGISLEKIQVIYNPVVTTDLLSKAQESVEDPWFASGELPVILGAGRLMYQKDFPTLIRAFAKVRQQRPCHLAIIGSETVHKAELEALIHELHLEKEVKLLGFANNPYAYMAKAAVFVMSSRFEGFGNVLVEAMATGTAVVSTDCESGPAEILEYGKYGRLVPVGDVDGLANAIIETLDHPTDSKKLQERAQEFTTEKIAKEYLSFFQQLTK